jgi:hypothetical protein
MAMMRFSLLGCAARCVKAFWVDTSGIILPYVTVMIPVLLGVSLIAIDGARFMSLQTQTQSVADALALAGAAELNGAPGARARATAAIDNLLANKLSTMGVTTSVQAALNGITFYQNLPAASQPLDPKREVTDDGHARFVAVTLNKQTVQAFFPLAYLVGGNNSYSSVAQAVAGFTEISCQYTPLFVCNPFEPKPPAPAESYDDATAALYNETGSPIVLLQEDHNGQFFPGNFGFVQSPKFSGNSCGSGNNVAQALAQVHPPACFDNTNITTETGNITPASDALNTRLDIWNGSFKSCSKKTDYPPDQNVRKGYTPGSNSCNPNTPTPAPPGNYQAMGLPPDNNMIVNGSVLTDNSVPIGNGEWACGDISSSTTAPGSVNTTSVTKGKTTTYTTDITVSLSSTAGITLQMAASGTGVPSGSTVKQVVSSLNTVTLESVSTTNPGTITIGSGQSITTQGYWNTAHPAGTTGAGNAPAGCTGDATISRQSVYDYENAHGYQTDASVSGEVGNPTCNNSVAADTSGTRRNLYVAVANCQALQAENGKFSGKTPSVSVAAIVKFFLTAPVASSTSAVYGEWGGIVTPGNGGGVLYYQVQLYR